MKPLVLLIIASHWEFALLIPIAITWKRSSRDFGQGTETEHAAFDWFDVEGGGKATNLSSHPILCRLHGTRVPLWRHPADPRRWVQPHYSKREYNDSVSIKPRRLASVRNNAVCLETDGCILLSLGFTRVASSARRSISIIAKSCGYSMASTSHSRVQHRIPDVPSARHTRVIQFVQSNTSHFKDRWNRYRDGGDLLIDPRSLVDEANKFAFHAGGACKAGPIQNSRLAHFCATPWLPCLACKRWLQPWPMESSSLPCDCDL